MENKEIFDILKRLDDRVSSIENELFSMSSIIKKVYKINVDEETSDSCSAKSTEDVSSVLSSIRAGLFNVMKSPDDDTHTELSSLISGLQDAKKRLGEISDKISQSSDEPSEGA